MLSRRTMFAGLAATIAAPAIIRTPGLLMPIKAYPAELYGIGPAMTATEVLQRVNRLHASALVHRVSFRDYWAALADQMLADRVHA
jgi:hypothetical protein